MIFITRNTTILSFLRGFSHLCMCSLLCFLFGKIPSQWHGYVDKTSSVVPSYKWSHNRQDDARMEPFLRWVTTFPTCRLNIVVLLEWKNTLHPILKSLSLKSLQKRFKILYWLVKILMVLVSPIHHVSYYPMNLLQTAGRPLVVNSKR